MTYPHNFCRQGDAGPGVDNPFSSPPQSITTNTEIVIAFVYDGVLRMNHQTPQFSRIGRILWMSGPPRNRHQAGRVSR